MNPASRGKRPWDHIEYQRIVSATYRDGEVVVVFADDAEARVPSDRLVSKGWPEPNWSGLRADDFHVIVPSPAGDVEIPWDVIRVHSDPAFDAFWRDLVTSSTAAHPTTRAG